MAYTIGTVQRRLVTIMEESKRARDTWDEINSHAFPLANTLTNSVLQSRYVDEPQYWHPLLVMNFPNLIQKFDAKMQRIIHKQNQTLIDHVQKMEKQYNKMNLQYKELVALYDSTRSVDFADKPIFQTCPLLTFVQRMKPILEMYKQELETKQSLTKEQDGIQSVLTREEAVVLLSIWINQPSLISSALKEWDDICSTEMTLAA